MSMSFWTRAWSEWAARWAGMYFEQKEGRQAGRQALQRQSPLDSRLGYPCLPGCTRPTRTSLLTLCCGALLGLATAAFAAPLACTSS